MQSFLEAEMPAAGHSPLASRAKPASRLVAAGRRSSRIAVMTAVAIHEAAHATIARVLGLNVKRAAARPGDARVVTKYRVNVPKAQWAQTVSKLLLVDLAGCSAERRATGKFPDGKAWQADRRNAISRALRLVVLDEHQLDDDELNDSHRDEAEAIVAALRPTAAALVEEPWAQIERVAAALADRRILTGSDVDALMAGAPATRVLL